MPKRRLPVLLAGLLLATLVVAPIQAAAEERAGTAPSYGTTVDKVSIKTRHGHVYAEVARPVKDGKMVKGPAVLTYSPYSALGRSANRELVAEGYVAIFADLIGTGNSGGCYDYGAKREKESAYDVVEWIAKQKWSTGKVAMTGSSYNGTTATAAAVMDPPHLTTIIPEAAISRWYEYAYSGGIRYFLNNENPADQGFDTPLAFDAGLAAPPPGEPEAGDYPDRLVSSSTPCDEVKHIEAGYDDTPDYNKFWLERDYIDGPDNVENVDIPVLIAHNWGDWNVKQEGSINLYKALKARSDSPKVSLYMGNRYQGHGVPGGEYAAVKKAWLDHYLMGKDNGIEKLADVTSHMSDYDGATKWYSGKWPETRNLTLYAQNQPVSKAGDYEWKLLPTEPRTDIFEAFGDEPPRAAFPSTGANFETHANHHTRSPHEWIWFETPMLKENLRVFGEIKVQHYSKIARKWVTLTPGIVDIKPDCHESVGSNHTVRRECLPRAVQSVTRGFLDSRYRNGLHKQVLLTPNKPFQTTVATKPIDYTFKKGHYFGVMFQTEIIDWMVSKPYPGCDAPPPDPSGNAPLNVAGEYADACSKLEILWAEGRTRLVLPVVGAPKDSMDLFNYAPHNHDDGCLITPEGICVPEP